MKQAAGAEYRWTDGRVGRVDHLVGAALALGYVVVLALSTPALAMSRDESFYVVAAQRYGEWIELLATRPAEALRQEVIDAAWSYNREHPPLAKLSFALGWLAQKHTGLFTQESLCYRLGGMLSAGLLLWLTYIFGARAARREVGLFAALALATLPRFFYHAHLNCFDVPVALAVTFTVYAWWRSLQDRRWALLAGLAFGLALATKHNSWLVPPVLLVHWIWLWCARRAARTRGEDAGRTPAPWGLLAMLTIGPLVLLSSWPWMWHDTLERIREYVLFHTEHVHYNMAYLGTNYHRPPLPISYPFVMTLYTIPLTISCMILGGVLLSGRQILPRSAQRWIPGHELHAERRSDPWLTHILWLGCAATPMLVIALPHTPIFGGTKHWFTAYPFLCLFAGITAVQVGSAARTVLMDHRPEWRGPASLLAGAILLVPGICETAYSHPFGLSHYTITAGGVRGAASLGMNRQFWGFTTGSLTEYLHARLPRGGKVFLCDTTIGTFRMLQKDGSLSNDIEPARKMSDADLVLVHHEDHFAEVDFQAWQVFGSVQPDHVLRYEGVPLISVYANPHSRQLAARKR